MMLSKGDEARTFYKLPGVTIEQRVRILDPRDYGRGGEHYDVEVLEFSGHETHKGFCPGTIHYGVPRSSLRTN
jgi:hypothetical protein